jgi:signal peptidase II
VRGLQERRPLTALNGRPAAGRDRRAGPSAPRRAAVAAAVMVGVVAADQLSKWWAVTRLARGPIHVIGTVDLELSRNTGASFSQFQGKAFVLVPVALLLIAVLAVMVWRSPTTGRAALLGLILGGALSNLCDRFFRDDHGAVVDFVALHFWPTFNVADASIVVGCILLLVSLARRDRLW